jgi:hypothetical protein
LTVSKKLGALAVVGAFAVTAVPALAKAPASHPAHPSHPTQSAKCTAHRVGYVASGALVQWSATQNADGTYTGTIVVTVMKANHHAKSAEGTSVSYTLTDAKVSLNGSTTTPVAGATVKLIGKINSIAKKCTSQTGAGIVTVRKVMVR